MFVFDLWRQIRKKLRRRRWVGLAMWVMLLVGAGALYQQASTDAKLKPIPAVTVASAPVEQEPWMAELKKTGGARAVMLTRIYVCGEETVRLGSKKPDEIIALYASHPTWRAELDGSDKLTFVERINDLSPACKSSAYIGVDRDGNLTLFEGPPQEDKAVRTFFQLNIQHLESALPKDTVRQLQEGIRITDLAEYNSVLSTFGNFARIEVEKVMKAE